MGKTKRAMKDADHPPPRPTDGSDTPTYNQIFFDALDLLNKKTD